MCAAWVMLGLGAPGGRPVGLGLASVRRERRGRRDALQGKGPRRRPQRRLGRRLEEVAKAVGGGYCWLQMPSKQALAARGTVAGHRLGALGEGDTSAPYNASLRGRAGRSQRRHNLLVHPPPSGQPPGRGMPCKYKGGGGEGIRSTPPPCTCRAVGDADPARLRRCKAANAEQKTL